MFTQRENALIELLRQVKEILNKYNIEFWLDCGTLLGAVRSGKFIPWEHDIDLGAWQEKVSHSLKMSISRELFNEGFDVYVAKNWITIKKNEGTWLDINFYSLLNDKAIMSRLNAKNLIGKFLSVFLKTLSVPYFYKIDFRKISLYLLGRNISVVISRILSPLLRKRLAQIVLTVYEKIGSEDVSWIVPSRYFSDLSIMRFCGMEFRMPAKTEEYLAYRYGEDWHISRRDWTTSKDDGAVSSLDKRIRNVKNFQSSLLR